MVISLADESASEQLSIWRYIVELFTVTRSSSATASLTV